MAKVYTRGGHVFKVNRSREGVLEDLNAHLHGPPPMYPSLYLTYRLISGDIINRDRPIKSRHSVSIVKADIVAVEGE